MRSEQEIFDNLAALCSSQGFIHAVAAICFRDNIVGFSDELRAEDMALTCRLSSDHRLLENSASRHG